MAGDWIKMRGNLWDDPRVGSLADLTDCSEAAVIGGLYWLWATADQHTEDGVLPGLSLRRIDSKTGVPGLGAALVSVGWITEVDGGIRIERFDEHNGASAKKRAVTAKRVANHRSSNDDVTPAALQGEHACVTGALAREREREREEKSSSLREEGKARSRPPSIARPEGVSEQTWSDWLELRKAKKAAVTETVLAEAHREAHKAGMSLQRFLEIWCMRGSQGLQAEWLRSEERRPAGGGKHTAAGAAIFGQTADHREVIDV